MKYGTHHKGQCESSYPPSRNPGHTISEISRLDIQDRFGTFWAIKWPAEDFSKYDDVTVLQDLFPATFAHLFKDDKLLEEKVAPTKLQENITS
jgi:hypothetical protein